MVWVIDHGFRRWVPNPSVAAAWHFDLSKVKVISATELAISPRAADWRSAPVLVRGTGPAVYVIDDLLPLDAVVLPPASPAVVGEVLLPRQIVVGGCASTGLEAVLPLALLVLARRRGCYLSSRPRRHDDLSGQATQFSRTGVAGQAPLMP
jgi:uncharacterized protein (TIGR03382 family)